MNFRSQIVIDKRNTRNTDSDAQPSIAVRARRGACAIEIAETTVHQSVDFRTSDEIRAVIKMLETAITTWEGE